MLGLKTLKPVEGKYYCTNNTNADYTAKEEALVKPENTGKINHPSHYTWLKDLCGIEVIDIAKHLDFCTGNVIKYVLRAGHKSEAGYTDDAKAIEDLKKAEWYIKEKIKMLEYNLVKAK